MIFAQIRTRAATFLRDEKGLAALEYAIMAIVLVGVIGIIVEGPMQTAMKDAFEAVGTAVKDAAS
ncbi:Flp family type IVb pilin [Caulobacter segnis]|uniref:Flp family type IVb pilin n=1 Tax=Caulobacter segnis TaxID=88688 RepID=UPI00240F3DD5|nr:Flp family type IVb pilin [Caulobacter segnis]MDG2520734.1 Flp family type IVb pilin [Caulobacter segnis]